MSEMKLILVGFGNVGRAFAQLLLNKSKILEKEFHITPLITGIATGHHGMAIDPAGIDLEKALAVAKAGRSLDFLSKEPKTDTIEEFILKCPGDVLFENSPLNHETGRPASDYLKIALEKGMHAITANKGPVVHAYAELSALARSRGKAFLFESSVMDGAPIFSLFRGSLPAVTLRGFRGILNSCTNLILGLMEEGRSFEEAVAHAQSIGIAETDPSADVDGWDAAIKVAALVTVLMGIKMTPQEVDRRGIRLLTPEMILSARQSGERWKLVCTARKSGRKVHAKVAPERVAAGSPLYSINGTSSYVQFDTDVLPGLGIVETNPGPDTTAYGIFADFLNAIRGI